MAEASGGGESLGRAVLELATDKRGFLSDLRGAETDTRRLESSFSSTRIALLGMVGVTAGVVTGLVSMARQVADIGDTLDEMNIKTGVSVETLSSMSNTLQMNGSNLQDFGRAINITQRNLAEAASGTGEVNSALKGLGFTLADMQGGLVNTDKFLEQFAIRLFRDVPDAGKRTELAMQLMGRSGAQLLPVLEDVAKRGLAGIREESDRLGTTWSGQMAIASAKFNDALTRAGATMQSMKVRFIGPLIEAFVSLADKMGLGGPEAQRKIQLQTQLNALDQVRLQLNTQLQTADTMRAAGLRTGIASDEIYGAMLKKGNDIIRERTALQVELGKVQAKPTAAADPAATAAAAQATRLAATLDVLKQRANELFKAGIAPGTEEITRMLTVLQNVEAAGRKAFGLEIPDGLQKSLDGARTFIDQIARAGNIDITKIVKDLPPILRDAATAADEGFGFIFKGGELIAQMGGNVKTVGEDIGGWNARLAEFEAETKKIDLPKTLAEWRSGTESYGTVVNLATGQQHSFNLEVERSISLMEQMARARAAMEASIKKARLTSNITE